MRSTDQNTHQVQRNQDASFTALTDATAEDWVEISKRNAEFKDDFADRMLDQLRLLRDDRHGFAIDRMEHCLQSASRALRDGRDDEYVLCALMHDVGAALAPHQHGLVVAIMLQPYISKKNHWMLLHHGIFQGYYYLHFKGRDRNARDRFRDHPLFDYTAEFCEKYDQNCFDPTYESLPLESFEPMVRRLLARPLESSHATPLPNIAVR